MIEFIFLGSFIGFIVGTIVGAGTYRYFMKKELKRVASLRL